MTEQTEHVERVSRKVALSLLTLFESWNWTGIFEVTLPNHRRADVMGLTNQGKIFIVEIKSSANDFHSDSKWTEYLDYCDSFYFAAPLSLGGSLFPEEHGLIMWDGHEAELIRCSTTDELKAARRSALIKRLFQKAARELSYSQLRGLT